MGFGFSFLFLFCISNSPRNPDDKRRKAYIPLLSDYLKDGKLLNIAQNKFMNITIGVIAGEI